MPKVVNIDSNELYHLYIEKKLSCKDIAKIFGVSPRTIWKYLKNNNIPIRENGEAHRGKRPTNRIRPSNKEIWLAFEKGGPKYIADTYNVHLATAYQWLKTAGIEYNPTPHAVKPPNSQELLNHINEGLSLEKIAKLYNVSRPTIAKWLKEYGIQYNSKPHRIKEDFTKEDVIELYLNQGIPLKNVASILNTTYIVLRSRCKEWGINVNPRPHKIEFLTEELLIEKYLHEGLSGFEIANELNVNPTTIYRHLELNNIKARDAGYTSSPEKQIRFFLEQHGLNVSKHKLCQKNGKRFELDIVCEDKNLAIEYCGLFWHSEHPSHKLYRGPNYHYDKMKACHELGWQLLTIFEDEYIYRRKQVEAIILAKLGIFQQRLYAKDCLVTEIEPKLAFDFCEENHLQGGAHIKTAFGLFHKNDLLGVITFSRHHRQYDELVLNRLCFKNNIQVVGGANKLLSYARKIIKEPIVTWSDNRWSTGNVYKKMGFRLDREYRPDYSYTTGKQPPQRRSKQSMRKSVTGCPKDVKEHEWCAQHGWYRIWDCGKKRWVLE